MGEKCALLRDEKAFTLIEIAVVMLVLGVIAGMAVPDLGRPLERFRVVTAARQMESEIRSLQQQAISLEDNGYSIVFASTFYLKRRDGSTISRVNLPAGVSIGYNNFPLNQLDVNLKGMPLNNGHLKITGATTGETRYVIVYALTGRIRIDTVPP